MRNQDLAKDYIRRAAGRLRALDVLYEDGHWADVVREAQEVVELALKAGLRAHGVDPPRLHDVSDVLLAERDRLPAALTADLDELVRILARTPAGSRARLLRSRRSHAVGLLHEGRCHEGARRRPLHRPVRPAARLAPMRHGQRGRSTRNLDAKHGAMVMDLLQGLLALTQRLVSIPSSSSHEDSD